MYKLLCLLLVAISIGMSPVSLNADDGEEVVSGVISELEEVG